MAVSVSVARVALGCAALAAVAAASPAEARALHHGRHSHHRVERVAAQAPAQQDGWGTDSWGRNGWGQQGWGQQNWSQQNWSQNDWGQSNGRQETRRQSDQGRGSWGDPRGTWAGAAASSQSASAPSARSERVETSAAPAGSGLKAMVARHAAQNGVPFALADAVVKIESGYNPRARNRSGAMGLMQIKTQTARGQGFAGSAGSLLDPDTNLRYAMRYLGTAYRMSGGNVCATVMRYQSGHFARRMSGADRSYCGRARHLMAQA